MGRGQFKLVRKPLQERGILGHLHQPGPQAFKAFALVVNQAGGRKDAELGQNLEPVADAQDKAPAGVVPVQGVSQETFRFQLRQASAGNVVPVAEAAADDDEAVSLFIIGAFTPLW